jgi:hypothetical protein
MWISEEEFLLQSLRVKIRPATEIGMIKGLTLLPESPTTRSPASKNPRLMHVRFDDSPEILVRF